VSALTAEPRWVGYCHGCRRFDVEVETRYDHGARTLCDWCCDRPTTARCPEGDVAKRDVLPRGSQEGLAETRGVGSEEEKNHSPLLATGETAAVEWLRRRAGRDDVPTPRHAVAACIHRLIEHETGERRLEIKPLALPDGASRVAICAADAFAQWEAARQALDVFAGDDRIVLSDRLWAALAGLERIQVYRAKRWLLARDVLVAERPEPSPWEGRPTMAYRRGGMS
jgi:hypothetical protein